MTEILSRLSPPPGGHQRSRRVGRGPGSRVGKISGRGQKGQKARHGGNFGKLHFQGGQTPLQRRLPKRGFRVPFPVVTAEVNVAALDRFAAGTKVDEALMKQHGLVGAKADRIKVLGNGALTKKLTVVAQGFSKGAARKIEEAGGKAVVEERSKPESA